MNKLQELRKKSFLSQSELAKLTGISVRYIQEIEGGRKNMNKIASETVYKLCSVLKCDIHALLDTENIDYELMEYLSSYLADLEMNSGSHDDFEEDYDSSLAFYLSNAESDSYIDYLTDNWVESEEKAMEIQNMVIAAIQERCDNE